MAPIREFYPEEYRLGMECLAAIRQRCHADLSDDEGGFIALHIVNAELNTTMSVVNDVTRFVDGCVQVVEYFYNCHFDRDALDFSRFTVHLRFFAQRVFQGKQEQEKRYPRRSVPRPRSPVIAANTTNAPAALRSMSATSGTRSSRTRNWCSLPFT